MIQILDGATASVDGAVLTFAAGDDFRVGERVKTTREFLGGGPPKGSIGVIETIRKTPGKYEGKYRVKFEGEYGGFQWVNAEDLTRA